MVSVDTHVGTAVTLDSTPAVGEGTVRVWYLYTLVGNVGPTNMEAAPRFVKEIRSQYLDTRFLNSALNLSDLADAPTARLNLGFTVQTSGAVLLGDGSTTFTSDPTELFWDTAGNFLGVGTNVPSVKLHVIGSSIITVDVTVPQIYGSSASGGDLLINSTSHATKGDITLGSVLRIDEANLRAYISNNTSNFGLSTAITSIVGSVAETNLNLMNTASSTAPAILEFEKRRGGAGGTTDVANADLVGRIDFNVRRNTGASTDSIATIYATYEGDGTTRTGELRIGVSTAGAPTDRIILDSNQDIYIGTGQKQSAAAKTGFYTGGPGTLGNGELHFKVTGGSYANGFILEGPASAWDAGTKFVLYPDNAEMAIGLASNPVFFINNQGRIRTDSGSYTYHVNIAQSSTNTTVTAPTATDPVISLEQVSATNNNFGMLAFSSQGDFLSAAVAGVHQGHLTGSSGHLTFLVRNAGTVQEAVHIRENHEVRFLGTTSGYVGVSTVAAPTSYSLVLPSAVATINNAPLLSDTSGNLSWGTSTIPSFKSGTSSISSGARTKAITFGTTFGSTNYQVFCTIRNTAQLTPQYLSWTLISQTNTGFSIELNEVTDSANYELSWAIIGNYDP